MFKVLILVCSSALSRAECVPQNARDVMEAEPSTMLGMCGFLGMAALAGTSIGRSLRDNEYPKVICERVR